MRNPELERKMVRYCAPTLANLKTGSLFRFQTPDNTQLQESLVELNQLLNKRDVYVEAMLWRKSEALLYIYRKTELQKDLNNPKVINILKQYDYESNDATTCIEQLKKRLAYYTCFPHEIGLFLGYPPEDVQGFIENKGNNCKYCGLWKVYCNKEETCCLFEKIKKQTSIYMRVFSQSRSLEQLVV